MRTVTIAWDPAEDRFTATGKDNHRIVINAPRLDPTTPSTGFSPTELLLAGAGACTAWDVLEIMRKKRRPLASLEVRVEGDQDDSPPHAYTVLRMHFTASGRHVDRATLEKVLRLSSDRYCSVVRTIRPETRIEESVEIV